MKKLGTVSYSVLGRGVVGQGSSKHGKQASSHDTDWLENEVTRPHGNTKNGFILFSLEDSTARKQAAQPRVNTGPQLAMAQLAPRGRDRCHRGGRTSPY